MVKVEAIYGSKRNHSGVDNAGRRYLHPSPCSRCRDAVRDRERDLPVLVLEVRLNGPMWGHIKVETHTGREYG